MHTDPETLSLLSTALGTTLTSVEHACEVINTTSQDINRTLDDVEHTLQIKAG